MRGAAGQLLLLPYCWCLHLSVLSTQDNNPFPSSARIHLCSRLPCSDVPDHLPRLSKCHTVNVLLLNAQQVLPAGRNHAVHVQQQATGCMLAAAAPPAGQLDGSLPAALPPSPALAPPSTSSARSPGTGAARPRGSCRVRLGPGHGGWGHSAASAGPAPQARHVAVYHQHSWRRATPLASRMLLAALAICLSICGGRGVRMQGQKWACWRRWRAAAAAAAALAPWTLHPAPCAPCARLGGVVGQRVDRVRPFPFLRQVIGHARPRQSHWGLLLVGHGCEGLDWLRRPPPWHGGCCAAVWMPSTPHSSLQAFGIYIQSVSH